MAFERASLQCAIRAPIPTLRAQSVDAAEVGLSPVLVVEEDNITYLSALAHAFFELSYLAGLHVAIALPPESAGETLLCQLSAAFLQSASVM